MRLLESKETNTMLSAAIPSRDLLPYLDEYIHGKAQPETAREIHPVYTGIVLFQQAGRESPPAYVDRVIAGSPAARAGLRPDDLVVRIDDYSIRSCKEFREILTKYAPGQTAQLTYKRGTKIVQTPLQFEEEKQ
jgi:serine protease Do